MGAGFGHVLRRARRVGDSRPWRTQSNFAGVWNMTLTEDWPDRLPGPELGDYAGLPLNANDRMRAQSWSASILVAAGLPVPGAPIGLREQLSDMRIWEEIDTGDAAA